MTPQKALKLLIKAYQRKEKHAKIEAAREELAQKLNAQEHTNAEAFTERVMRSWYSEAKKVKPIPEDRRKVLHEFFSKWISNDEKLATDYASHLKVLSSPAAEAKIEQVAALELNSSADAATTAYSLSFEKLSPKLLDQLGDAKEEQLKKAGKSGDLGTKRECAVFLALLAQDRGDLSKASDYCHVAVNCSEQMEDSIAEATARNEWAWVQYRAGDLGWAQANLEECEKIWEKFARQKLFPDLRQRCRTLDYRAVCLRAAAKGNNTCKGLDEAEKLLKQSLKLREKLDSDLGRATTIHRLAHVYAAKCSFRINNGMKLDAQVCRVASRLYLEAEKLRLKRGHIHDACRSTIQRICHLTTVSAAKDAQQIRGKLHEIEKIAQQQGYREIWVRCQICRSRLERKLGRTEKGLSTLPSLLSNGGDTLPAGMRLAQFEQALLLEEIAKCHDASGDEAERKRCYGEAIKIWKAINNHTSARRIADRA